MDECARNMEIFTANLAGTLASVISSCAVFVPLLLLPHGLVAFGLFAAIVRALGWPMRQLIFAGFVLFVLMSVSPCMLQLMAAYAVVKTWYWRKPLLDREYWNRRCQGRRQHQN